MDSTPENLGGDFGDDAVDIQASTDNGGGFHVGWIDDGEWLDYDLTLAESGEHKIKLRVASEPGNGQVSFLLNGEDIGAVIGVSATGGWEEWLTIEKPLGFIESGHHTLRIQFNRGLFNLNWFEVQLGDASSIACDGFGSGISQGNVSASVGTEISGIVASQQMDELLWVHNDSGDAARVYAVRSNGEHVATVNLSGVNANDYEDIARDKHNRIYVGDIGDNPRQRGAIQLLRFDEPIFDAGAGFQEMQVFPEVITLVYPDGAHDAETLLVDPITDDIFVLSKVGGGDSVLYRAAAPLSGGTTVMLSEVQRLQFGGELTTAGDVSSDGRWILVRTYGNLYAWRRAEGQTIADALGGQRLQFSANNEPQGEAVSFSADGLSYFTVSEGTAEPLFRFHCNLD